MTFARHSLVEVRSRQCKTAGMEAILIEREALRLPEGQRALLADRLLQSLNPDNDQILEAWAKEADARWEAWQRGEMSSENGPEVVARLRAGLR